MTGADFIFGRDIAYDFWLHDMCDKGASAFHSGRCEAVKFKIWGTEREKVENYMTRHHPDVPYICAWPEFYDPSADGKKE